MKIIQIKSEDELDIYLKDISPYDKYLKFLLGEVNRTLLDYFAYDNYIDFGAFVELKIILSTYLAFKYNVDVVPIDLTKFFCNINGLDYDAYISD